MERSSKDLDTDYNDDSSETTLLPREATAITRRRSYALIAVPWAINFVLVFMVIYLWTQLPVNGANVPTHAHLTDFGIGRCTQHAY